MTKHATKNCRTKGTKSRYKDFVEDFKSKLTLKFSSAYIAKISMLTAIAFLLYAFAKFPLPFMFPAFLDIQISELPALLAGFSMGPISGCIVVVLKCLFKLPMTSTAYVGELTDIIIGICFVLPASLIYKRHKDRKHALIGLLVGIVCVVCASLIINRFISIPFYLEFFFNGNENILLDMLRPLYKNITMDNFYLYYLGIGVLPFNLLRGLIVGFLTFVLYKKLSRVLHWSGEKKQTQLYGEHISKSILDTNKIARLVAENIDKNTTILLSGDLGAGKTTFTKGLALALGITDDVVSPTFTILNIYENADVKLNHLDMYRIESSDELFELGIEETIFGDGITVIEWNKFEQIQGHVIEIDIKTLSKNKRKFEIVCKTDCAVI